MLFPMVTKSFDIMLCINTTEIRILTDILVETSSVHLLKGYKNMAQKCEGIF